MNRFTIEQIRHYLTLNTMPAPLPNQPLLIFDVGKVLLDHDDEKFFSVMAAHGCSRDSIIRSWDTYRLVTGGNAGVTTLPQFFAAARDALGFQGGYPAFHQAWNCHFTPWPILPLTHRFYHINKTHY